jgi:superfamily I DNA/RNA helicase
MTWGQELPKNPFSESRTWKIVASAGCGKSHTIRETIKDLIQAGTAPEEIMYLIFNRVPADDFKAELKAELGLDFPWINTHHSIAMRLMGVPFEKILVGKRLKAFGEIYGMSFLGDEDEDKTEWDKILSSLDLKILDGSSDLDPYESLLLNRLKIEEEKGFYSFSRVLQTSIVLEKVPPNIKYVFVDECQDNGKIQFDYLDYLKSLPSIEGIMVVGDDKQAINLFKGGRYQLFLDWQADRYVCLGKTYRNAQKILDFANSIAEPINKRSPLTKETNVKQPGSVTFLTDLEDSISSIKNDLRQKKSVFVLSRMNKHKYIAMGTLARYNVPVSSKPLDRVKQTFLLMQSMAKHASFTYEEVLALLPSDDPEDGQLNKTAYWKRGALAKFIHGGYDIEKEPLALSEYYQFQAGKYEADLSLFGFSPDFLKDIFETLNGTIPRGVWRGVSDDEITQLEQVIKTYGIDYKPVRFSTIHGIKGSECDTVVLLTNIARIIQRTESSEIDEERRVWYVGATRARTSLIVCPIQEYNGIYTSIL